MSRTDLLFAVLAVGTFVGGTSAAEAQRPHSNSSAYRPRRPTLSPYLQLFRTDPGQILPSYQNFVQPRVEAREFRRAQKGNVQNLRHGLQQVQQSQQLQNTSGTIQSGIGSGFHTSRQYFGGHSPFFGTHRTQASAGAALVGTQLRTTTFQGRRNRDFAPSQTSPHNVAGFRSLSRCWGSPWPPLRGPRST
jgi:hypothetical protein